MRPNLIKRRVSSIMMVHENPDSQKNNNLLVKKSSITSLETDN